MQVPGYAPGNLAPIDPQDRASIAPPPRNLPPAVTAAALLAAAVFPTFATWLYFVVLPGGPWALTVYAVAKGLQFSFPLVWTLWVLRVPLRLRGVEARRDLLPGALSGAAILAVLFGLWRPLTTLPALGGVPVAIAAKMDAFGIVSPGAFLLLAAFYSVIHSLLEEYYWRWFLLGGLRRRMSPAAALALSSLAFMSHHVLVLGEFLGGYGAATWLLALAVAGAGALWSWLYLRSGALYAPWLSHACADAGLMAIGYWLWRTMG
ncbi:MAG TPA: CPBP family intramembrane glutamic endopeptidase [Thermoanaerobaculia bacterium]|nr:CPBP family intramembrane glutamic endopeptidase [Thermoanaerobaculia bacterium]